MKTRIFLIRHGETDWNRQKRYMGSADIGLNSRGRYQAKCLALKLSKEKIDRIYSSDRKRAFDFAKIIFATAEIEPDLREMSFGIFEGMTYKEAMRKHSCLYRRWVNDPCAIAIPEGEGFNDFRERVLGAFKRIVRANRGSVVAVVTHGGPIRIILCEILKTSDFWNKIPREASVTIIDAEWKHKWVR